MIKGRFTGWLGNRRRNRKPTAEPTRRMLWLTILLVPLLLGLAPRLRLPSVVLELVVGIVVGPAVLGWVRPDLPVQILALLGLAFLLFLAGLEVDLRRLTGKLLRTA